ncbi:MAG: hypothetical protein KAJ13_12405 [Gemmatimonadetes bacterium]|nr:hypothetical protein [Gemmatimonadota bacterium]
MKHFWRPVVFLIKLVLLAFVLLSVFAFTGRFSVFLLAIGTLTGLTIFRRRKPLWIAPMWAFVLATGTALTLAPIDVRFDSRFPRGVSVRPFTYGLRFDPVETDAAGVPVTYWTGSCMIPLNAPDLVLVIGW